jgi:hypothetical protein
MIGTAGATILMLVGMLLAGVLGVVVGGTACFVLKLHWEMGWAALDAWLAVLGAAIAAWAIPVIEIAKYDTLLWKSDVWLVFTVAATTVLAEHLLRLVHQRRWARLWFTLPATCLVMGFGLWVLG